MRRLLAASCVLVFSIATANGQSPRMGPPPPPNEVIPAIPQTHPNWVWRGGYYRWHAGNYIWRPGAYISPPRPGYRWYPGHWRQTPRGWVWIEGRWR